MSTVFDFSTPEISQSDVQKFADTRVNLPREQAENYREKVRILRRRLDTYVGENPTFALRKMLLSGSLAKGTALRNLNDVDVGVYVSSNSAPETLKDLLHWLVTRLRTTYHTIPEERIYVDEPCVVIEISGLKVDVTPILYEGDPKWRGYLWTRYGQERVLTSIPMHLDFLKKRKQAHPKFAQAVRLLKWWASQRRIDTQDFAIQSFLIELISAKISDGGGRFNDYQAGLEQFFLYLQQTQLEERIAFTDNYGLGELPEKTSAVVEIFDPVTSNNNVASSITETNRKAILSSAEEALDALSWATSSQTKQDALACWKELMGPTFNP